MTILLLEDNDLVRSCIVAMLEDLGHSVCAGSNAADLDDLLAVPEPHLLIVDVLLGQSDGIALANQLVAEHPGLPVVAISGADQGQPLERLRGAGDCRFLLKPFGSAELLSVMSDLLA